MRQNRNTRELSVISFALRRFIFLSLACDVSTWLYACACVLCLFLCVYSRALDSSCKNMLKCNLTKVMLNKLAATAMDCSSSSSSRSSTIVFHMR